MARGRRSQGDANQYRIDDGEASRHEDKQVVRSVSYRDAVAHAAERGLPIPTASGWRNGMEVATYLIHVRGAGGMFPSEEKIATGAFKNRKRGRASVMTVRRALRVLRDFNLVVTEYRGPLGSRYEINFEVYAEVRAAGHRARARTTIEPEQITHVEPQVCSISSPKMFSFTPENVPLPNIGINQQPTFSQPTGVDRSSTPVAVDEQWLAVVVEIDHCGINQAERVVDVVRDQGASPTDVRAIVAYWKLHRDGWDDHAEEKLYRRLQRWQPGELARDGWPAFTQEYQKSLEAKHRVFEWHEAAQHQVKQREENAAKRDELARQRESGGRTLLDIAQSACPGFAAILKPVLKSPEPNNGD